MNMWMSILFRAIPLAMGAVCLAFGLYVWTAGTGPGAAVAGPVVTFLTAICIALFSTAATIIRQLVHRYGTVYRITLPVLGYFAGGITIFMGGFFYLTGDAGTGYVIGHVIFGIGLVTCCVATVATASTRFSLIPVNSAGAPGIKPDNAFSARSAYLLYAVPMVCALVAFVVGWSSLRESGAPQFVGGNVLVGLGMVCASLVALVVSVLRQVQNNYNDFDRCFWPWYVAVVGALCILWGLCLLLFVDGAMRIAPGFVLIGLGIVCWSILSKVLLLASVWRQTCALASRIPLIPVVTALLCLFLSAFLFQRAVTDGDYYVPARVMVGLGAICFTLFSIVSILESGTSGKKD